MSIPDQHISEEVGYILLRVQDGYLEDSSFLAGKQRNYLETYFPDVLRHLVTIKNVRTDLMNAVKQAQENL